VTCTNPIEFDALVAYWLGELPEEREATLEEHLFSCAHCTKRLEGLAALASGVRAAVRNGKLSMVVSAPFVEAMKRAGLILREYRLEPGCSVNCTIRANDDAVISRIQAPLVGVKRLDVVRMRGGDAPEERITDVPFDPDSGEVLVIPSAAWLKKTPAFTMRMRLIAMDETEEKRIGDYTFNHSPS
jgi:Putative zinc-finger